MKLDNAIELSKEAETSLRNKKFIDHADAIKLLIEAGEEKLERDKEVRK